MEYPLPILTSEHHCSLFAWSTQSLSRELEELKPQNISSKISWVQLCKYSALYVQGQESFVSFWTSPQGQNPLENVFSCSAHGGR